MSAAAMCSSYAPIITFNYTAISVIPSTSPLSSSVAVFLSFHCLFLHCCCFHSCYFPIYPLHHQFFPRVIPLISSTLPLTSSVAVFFTVFSFIYCALTPVTFLTAPVQPRDLEQILPYIFFSTCSQLNNYVIFYFPFCFSAICSVVLFVVVFSFIIIVFLSVHLPSQSLELTKS